MTHTRVQEAFEKEFGGSCRLFSAPGRINLIGEHTDYNQGFVLPAAIDKSIFLAIAPSKGTKVRIRSLDHNQLVEFNIHEPMIKFPHWALYPYGVFREIQAGGYFMEGFDAVFGGDIPTGAGLSSSAALEIAFAVALNSIYRLQISDMELALIGQRAEHNYAGVNCGIMDQFASVHGKAGHAILLDCRSLEHDYFPLELSGHELILADTRVKHSLASSEYNLRRAQCDEGLMILQSQMPQVKSLRDVRSKDVYPYLNILGEEIFLRCEYVTEENERVIECCEALTGGDLHRVGQLLYLSHHGLSKKYHVSCKELDLLVDTAQKISGVKGARMMGGGFGGCTINLLESSAVDSFMEETTRAYQDAFGKPPLFYNVHVGDGAGER